MDRAPASDLKVNLFMEKEKLGVHCMIENYQLFL